MLQQLIQRRNQKNSIPLKDLNTTQIVDPVNESILPQSLQRDSLDRVIKKSEQSIKFKRNTTELARQQSSLLNQRASKSQFFKKRLDTQGSGYFDAPQLDHFQAPLFQLDQTMLIQRNRSLINNNFQPYSDSANNFSGSFKESMHNSQQYVSPNFGQIQPPQNDNKYLQNLNSIMSASTTTEGGLKEFEIPMILAISTARNKGTNNHRKPTSYFVNFPKC